MISAGGLCTGRGACAKGCQAAGEGRQSARSLRGRQAHPQGHGSGAQPCGELLISAGTVHLDCIYRLSTACKLVQSLLEAGQAHAPHAAAKSITMWLCPQRVNIEFAGGCAVREDFESCHSHRGQAPGGGQGQGGVVGGKAPPCARARSMSRPARSPSK